MVKELVTVVLSKMSALKHRHNHQDDELNPIEAMSALNTTNAEKTSSA
jgi:hypothetical protein